MLHAALPRERRERFARQLVLPEVGPSGQAALGQASVLVVGAGGLGAPAIAYLAGVGLARLGIVEPGTVSRSDLHRQILYRSSQVGRLKAPLAAAWVAGVDPELDVDAWTTAFTPENGRELVRGFDVVVDATDNPASRYLISDACVLEDRALVFGSVSRLEGQVARLVHDGAPCYRCLHPEPPRPASIPSCAEVGVLGPVAGTVGSWLALEAIRWLTGFGVNAPDGLLHLDMATWTIQRVAMQRRADCAICGDRPTIRELELEPAACLAGEPYPG